jgi:hypothetical protein
VLLTVKRLTASAESTQGELLINGEHEAWTLEPPTLEPPTKPRAVPAGMYSYVIAPSLRFGRNVIRVEDIPDFEDIEIHPGNFPRDTHGCCLVGKTESENFVGQSDAEFDELMGKVTPTGQIVYTPLP